MPGPCDGSVQLARAKRSETKREPERKQNLGLGNRWVACLALLSCSNRRTPWGETTLGGRVGKGSTDHRLVDDVPFSLLRHHVLIETDTAWPVLFYYCLLSIIFGCVVTENIPSSISCSGEALSVVNGVVIGGTLGTSGGQQPGAAYWI